MEEVYTFLLFSCKYQGFLAVFIELLPHQFEILFESESVSCSVMSDSLQPHGLQPGSSVHGMNYSLPIGKILYIQVCFLTVHSGQFNLFVHFCTIHSD